MEDIPDGEDDNLGVVRKKTSEDIPERTSPTKTPEQQRNAQAFFQASIQHQQYQSPIPPPEIMAGYEQILPGSLDRILAMAERQAEHRQGLESAVVRSNIRHELEGTVLGFILAFTLLIGSITLIFAGKEIIGLGTIAAEIAVLAVVYLRAQRQTQLQLRQQQERLLEPPKNIGQQMGKAVQGKTAPKSNPRPPKKRGKSKRR